MDRQESKRVKEVFQQALEIAEGERGSFVDRACADDVEVRNRVVALLEAYAGADGFLASRLDGPGLLAGRPVDEARVGGGYVGAMVGPYKILQLIGEGGFGTVYMAEQQEPIRRRVALKLIKLGMDTKQVVARFDAERQALAMMEHPNIARVLDAGATENGRPYFVMELVMGVPITEYCDEKCLSTHERLELFTEVCAAVQHAHQKGIIHRDIKPSNVLVTRSDGRAVPKVIDFGVARATGYRLTEETLFTEFGQFIGTPLYMSPEQAETSGTEIDTRSDIYSLGVLLYELLTGSTPYTSGQIRNVAYAEVLRVLKQVDPPPPSTRISQLAGAGDAVARLRRSEPGVLQRQLRGDLDWIVMKALERERDRRYSSASELATDIGRYFDGDPVSAGPPDLSYRLRKIAQRNRGRTAAAAAVGAAVVLGGATATWQAMRASAAAGRAQANAVLVHARTTEDPLLKALLVDAISDVPEMPGRLAVLREAANHRLPISVLLVPDFLNDMHFSPDGEYLVASFRDQTVRVWRADGTEPPRVFPHGVEVDEAQFGPDGNRILTGSVDGIVRVWPLDGGDPLLLKADRRIESASFSPDGTLITASTENGGPVWIWRADGRGAPVVLEIPGVGLYGDFLPDGKRLVTGGTDGVGRIWNVDGTGPLEELSGPPGWTYAIPSPDGARLALSGDGRVHVYETEGSTELAVLEHRGSLAWATRFNGELVTTASRDGTVRIWSVDRPDESTTLRHPLDRVDRSVGRAPPEEPARLPLGTQARISPDGARVLTRSIDGTIRVWDVDGTGPVTAFKGPGQGSFIVSPAGRFVSASFGDGSVRTWSLHDGGPEARILAHDDGVDDVAYSPDGRYLATAGHDGVVRVWSVDGAVRPALLDGHEGRVRGVRFSSDGRRLVTASDDGTVRIWTIDGSQEPVVLAHDGPLRDAAFSPDGARVAAGGLDDGRVFVWSSDGRTDPVVVTEHLDGISGVAFSPDGGQLLSASFDQWAQITPLEAGTDPVRLRGNYSVFDAEFSPDGEWVVMGSEDGDVRVIPSGGGPARVLRGEGTRVRTVAFSPDGGRVLAGADDGTIRIWRLDDQDEPIEMSGHNGPVTGAVFSPDGKSVASSSLDGTVRVWRVTWEELLGYVRSRLPVCLTPEQRTRYLAESTREARRGSEECNERLQSR